MGLYNFKEQFVPFILDGRKTHTIRAERVHPDKAGNAFHAYTGLRTKNARKLLTSTVVKVEEIRIWHEIRNTIHHDDFRVVIDGVGLEHDEREALARRDGFRDFAEMMAFWEGRLPFRGHIIHWRPIKENQHVRKGKNTQP